MVMAQGLGSRTEIVEHLQMPLARFVTEWQRMFGSSTVPELVQNYECTMYSIE
jgi:hypothetical protein